MFLRVVFFGKVVFFIVFVCLEEMFRLFFLVCFGFIGFFFGFFVIVEKEMI